MEIIDTGLPPDEEYEVEILVDFTTENEAQLEHDHVIDELIIKFVCESMVSERDLRRYRREIEKVEKIGYVEGLGVYVIRVSEMRRGRADANAVLNRFKNNRFVEFVEPNFTAQLSMAPNDPQFNTQQAAAMNRINALAGWSILSGNPAAPIAIIDTGMITHNDLPSPIANFSAVSALSANSDKLRHGTGVGGVAGAIGNNNIGGAGINWNASLMNVKVDDANGFISVANMARGITWAVDNGARVINISIAFASDSATLKNAIDYAFNRGVIIVAGTGNDGATSIAFPARYSNVYH
jgi:thermitase